MPTILNARFVLAVPNVEASARFFVDKMGFTEELRVPGWIFVAKDAAVLMLGECPTDLPADDIGSHSYFAYLKVDDAVAYHVELLTNGVKVGELTDQPWGMREFTVRTPDGHRLMIGQSLTVPI
jgi:catechol 2,3-dioxygenase-like lactoylglutathione lyase family enzyme